MKILNNLLSFFRKFKLTWLFGKLLSINHNKTHSRTYFITASFLFFGTSSAIYLTTILNASQTSLALDIVQQALINPPQATCYLKDDCFQYCNFVEDLKDIISYLEKQDLKKQDLPSYLTKIPRSGAIEKLFPVPSSLKPISDVIDQKRAYQIGVKIISVITVGLFFKTNYKYVKEFKQVVEKLLAPFLNNPIQAELLKQCLEQYLQVNNLSSIFELLTKPRLWRGLYFQFSVIALDTTALTKKIDYSKSIAYLLYLSGVNTNLLVVGTLITLNLGFFLSMGLIGYLPASAAALPATITTSFALLFTHGFKKLDLIALGSMMNSVEKPTMLVQYLKIWIRRLLEEFKPGSLIDITDTSSSYDSSSVNGGGRPELPAPPTSSTAPSPGAKIVMSDSPKVISDEIRTKYLK